MSKPVAHYEALLAGDIERALTLLDEQRALLELQPEDLALLSGYSVMLFNTGAASRQDEEVGDELEFLSKLQDLRDRYPNHEPTAVRLSRALLNALYSVKDLTWRLDVVDAMSTLLAASPANRRIRERFVTASLQTHLLAAKARDVTAAVRLSEGVRRLVGDSSILLRDYSVMLLAEQGLESEHPGIADEALNELRALQKAHPDNSDLAVFLVICLSVRKVEDDDSEEEEDESPDPFLEEIRSLYALHPEPVAKHFAVVLYQRLSRGTTRVIDKLVANSLEELRRLHASRPSNERVLANLAGALTLASSYAWYGCQPLKARQLMAEFDRLVREANPSERLAKELKEARDKTAKRSFSWALSGLRYNDRTQFVVMFTVILTIIVWKWIAKSL